MNAAVVIKDKIANGRALTESEKEFFVTRMAWIERVELLEDQLLKITYCRTVDCREYYMDVIIDGSVVLEIWKGIVFEVSDIYTEE